MSISISYASRRNEVWRWYWKAWRRGFWRIHLSVFLATVTTASLVLYDGVPHDFASFAVATLIGLLPLVGFVVFPMAKFKPQTRTLTVDDQGIETTIDTIKAFVPWQDVAEIIYDGEYLVIQRTNKNAFIVPPRAFDNINARAMFYVFVTARMKPNGS